MNKWQNRLEKWRHVPFISTLLRQLPTADIFLVGGMVRDAMIDRTTKDIDIVVRGATRNNIEKQLKALGEVNFVGKKFGVYKLKIKNVPGEIDIALPRTEHTIENTGARRDFTVTSDPALPITDDLSRRDFTINAMAWNIRNSELVDPFNGQKDISKKTVRTVGKPKDRFAEDYSRMLRALRFSCQLNFLIEKNTFAEIKRSAKNIIKISNGEAIVAKETIANELVKMFSANPLRTISLLEKSGMLSLLMPELLKMKKCPQPKQWHSEGDVWKHTMLVIENLFSKEFEKEFSGLNPSLEVIFSALYHDVGKPPTMKRSDRIRFNGHDAVSVKIFRNTAEQLKLSAGGLNVEAVEKIIGMHMLAANLKKAPLKTTTIEKYFFNEQFPGTELLMLMFADISASLPPSGKPNYSQYRALKKQIKSVGKLLKGKKLPKPLVTGTELMKKFSIKEGPQIGKLLFILREAQLGGLIKNKKQAFTLAKKNLSAK